MIKQRKLTISNFESELTGLAGSIMGHSRNKELYLLFDFGYPETRRQLATLEKALSRIGMYQAIDDALTHSETLARAEQYEEASIVILETTKSLMQASGTWDKLEKRYSKHKTE